jgi:hypothetical protein
LVHRVAGARSRDGCDGDVQKVPREEDGEACGGEDRMSYEPATYCTECEEAFDVYHAPEERICADCVALAEVPTD